MDIGVLGAGTWGMALARMLSRQEYNVVVWSALSEEVDSYSKTRRHPNLSNMVIPYDINFTLNIKEAVAGKELVLFAVPSIYMRNTASKAAPYISKGQIVVNVAKGLEVGTLMTMTQVITEECVKISLKPDIVCLSGPTHAEEVAIDLPTSIVVASKDLAVAKNVQNIFMSTCMRVYTSSDILGVELCGALKNIIALAAGISDGLGYGDNAKAAVITRGMAEITRLGIAMGCDEHTFMGLAGIGDLIVTATSEHSRNNRAGKLIGSGMDPKSAVKAVGMVVEGINALPAAIQMSKKYNIEMPIVAAVDSIINERTEASKAVQELLSREKKSEF